MPKTKKRASRSINRPLMWVAAAAIIVVILAAYFLTRPSPDTGTYPSNKGSTVRGAIAPTKNSSTESHSQAAQGGAQDIKGSSVAQTPSTQWTSSANKEITLKSPLAGAVLKSGDIVSGTAKVRTIQYRLMDDEVGVLAQGPLSVVDGKFSGKIFYRSQSKTGNLDIFSYDSSGAEINRLSIKVKLGS